MSGTFAAAQEAARQLTGMYNVVPFDSGSGSAVLAFMTQEARTLDCSGASLQTILERLEFIRKKVTVIFTLDTLEYARLSGRVSALQARITSLLQIKPIIVLREGLLDMADKVRTRSRSIDKVIDMVRQRAEGKLMNVAVVHAADPITGEAIAERMKRLIHIKQLIMTELSIAVAANLGPHTVGIVAYPVVEGDEGDERPR
jgi:DegV family protein with EDD domain